MGEEEQVRITFNPIREVVILEEIKHSNPEELCEVMMAGLPAGSVGVALWAEGIVFRHSALSPSIPIIAKERIKGKVYWDFVRYAEMPEYREELVVSEGKRVKIIKAQAVALVEVAKALKNRKGER